MSRPWFPFYTYILYEESCAVRIHNLEFKHIKLNFDSKILEKKENNLLVLELELLVRFLSSKQRKMSMYDIVGNSVSHTKQH